MVGERNVYRDSHVRFNEIIDIIHRELRLVKLKEFFFKSYWKRKTKQRNKKIVIKH
jgi:hypothetical protein